jgi:hypothetical protein
MTATHYLVMDLAFSYAGNTGADTDEEFDTFTDNILEALSELERVDPGLSEPDITAALARRQLSISMGIEADTQADAVRIFSANVRTALHMVGCCTGGWPVFRPADGDTLPPVRRVDLADA